MFFRKAPKPDISYPHASRFCCFWKPRHTAHPYTTDIEQVLNRSFQELQEAKRRQDYAALEVLCNNLLRYLKEFFKDHEIHAEALKKKRPIIQNMVYLAYVYRACSYYNQIKYKKAIQDCNTLLDFNCTHQHALWMRGLCYRPLNSKMEPIYTRQLLVTEKIIQLSIVETNEL